MVIRIRKERGDSLKAVKVGYVFNIFDENELRNIALRETGRKVEYDGKEYSLYSPYTYEDSQRVDMLLDVKGDLRIKDYEINGNSDRVR